MALGRVDHVVNLQEVEEVIELSRTLMASTFESQSDVKFFIQGTGQQAKQAF